MKILGLGLLLKAIWLVGPPPLSRGGTLQRQGEVLAVFHHGDCHMNLFVLWMANMYLPVCKHLSGNFSLRQQHVCCRFHNSVYSASQPLIITTDAKHYWQQCRTLVGPISLASESEKSHSIFIFFSIFIFSSYFLLFVWGAVSTMNWWADWEHTPSAQAVPECETRFQELSERSY